MSCLPFFIVSCGILRMRGVCPESRQSGVFFIIRHIDMIFPMTICFENNNLFHDLNKRIPASTTQISHNKIRKVILFQWNKIASQKTPFSKKNGSQMLGADRGPQGWYLAIKPEPGWGKEATAVNTATRLAAHPKDVRPTAHKTPADIRSRSQILLFHVFFVCCFCRFLNKESKHHFERYIDVKITTECSRTWRVHSKVRVTNLYPTFPLMAKFLFDLVRHEGIQMEYYF